jgi:hypothetical protein
VGFNDFSGKRVFCPKSILLNSHWQPSLSPFKYRYEVGGCMKHTLLILTLTLLLSSSALASPANSDSGTMANPLDAIFAAGGGGDVVTTVISLLF